MAFVPLHFAVASGKERCYLSFLRLGADPDLGDQTGFTPLHLATRSESVKPIRALAEQKANMDAADLQGRTPLQLAAFHGGEGILELLLELGANPLVRDQDGRTARFYAELAKNRDTAATLVLASSSRLKADGRPDNPGVLVGTKTKPIRILRS